MTDRTNLLEALDARRIPEIDLITILQWHFGHGRIDPTDPLVVTHAHEQDGEPALRSTYNKHGNLVDLIPGKAWTEADFDAVKAEIDAELNVTTTKVRRLVAFAGVPTAGTWRYRDVFQISPPPPEAPTPHFLAADHPFVLEVRFAPSGHTMLSHDRSLVATRRVELLLGVFLRFGVHSLHRSTRHVWTLIRVTEDPLVLGSELRQIGYIAPGLQPLADEFTPLGQSLPEIELGAYVGARGIHTTDTLSIPTGLASLLDKFFSLSPEEQSQFLRACYWFQHAHEVWDLSMSSVLTALIQAIETLLPPPRTDGHCPQCNRNIGPGPTQQFVDFVEEHAPGLSEDTKRHLYAVRSDLTHGNRLLVHDEYAGMGGHFTPEAVGQQHDVDHATLVARVALITWLMRRPSDG